MPDESGYYWCDIAGREEPSLIYVSWDGEAKCFHDEDLNKEMEVMECSNIKNWIGPIEPV